MNTYLFNSKSYTNFKRVGLICNVHYNIILLVISNYINGFK